MSTGIERAEIRLLASEQIWIEGEATRQLEKTAELPGMRLVVGLPDLHPGKVSPVGAVFVSEDRLYPHLVGNDVGCGMGLWRTDLSGKKMKVEKWCRKLSGLERRWEGDSDAWVEEQGFHFKPGVEGLGTLGGGNHFAELQRVEKIDDTSAFEELGLEEHRLVLLVHSGSRGLGDSLYRDHVAEHRAQGVDENSAAAADYLARHDDLQVWAQANRALLAHRFLSSLGAGGSLVLDLCHNSVGRKRIEGLDGWLHRKGATPSDTGPVVIPGSRGAMTYLVMPVGEQEANAFSVVHGAGRKWKRSDAKGKLQSRYSPASLIQTELGGRVICDDRDLLYEEAPQAYKNVDTVVDDLVRAGLVRVIATLRPVVTYKARRGS